MVFCAKNVQTFLNDSVTKRLRIALLVHNFNAKATGLLHKTLDIIVDSALCSTCLKRCLKACTLFTPLCYSRETIYQPRLQKGALLYETHNFPRTRKCYTLIKLTGALLKRVHCDSLGSAMTML